MPKKREPAKKAPVELEGVPAAQEAQTYTRTTQEAQEPTGGEEARQVQEAQEKPYRALAQILPDNLVAQYLAEEASLSEEEKKERLGDLIRRAVERALLMEDAMGGASPSGEEKAREAGYSAQSVEQLVREAKLKVESVAENLAEILKSETYKRLISSIALISAYLETRQEEIAPFVVSSDAVTHEALELSPFIEMELVKERDDLLRQAKNPDAAPTLEEVLLEGITTEGKAAPGPYLDIVTRAQENRAQFLKTVGEVTRLRKAWEALPRVTAKPPKGLYLPVDKVTTKIFDGKALEAANGQYKYVVSMNQGASVVCVIDIAAPPAGMTFSRELEPYDSRIFGGYVSMLRAGNQFFTVRQILLAAGFGPNPNKEQYARANASLTKMSQTKIYLNNKKEVEVYPKYKLTVVKDENLLEFHRESAIVNGALTESLLMPLTYPALATFTEARKQFTEVPRKVLESPVKKTDVNIALENYILRRIADMDHNADHSKKMLFNTIFKECGINAEDTRTGRYQRAKARETVHSLLDHYKATGHIKGYRTVNKDEDQKKIPPNLAKQSKAPEKKQRAAKPAPVGVLVFL